MSDERRSEGGGAIVVIVVVLILIGLVGIVGVGGGMWVVQRMTLQSMQAEVEARQAMAQMMESEMRAKEAAMESIKALEQSRVNDLQTLSTTAPEVLLQIDAAGDLTLAGKSVKLAELPAALKQVKADHPEGVKLKIQAHPETPYANVVGVQDAAVNAGIENVSVEVLPKPETAPQP